MAESKKPRRPPATTPEGRENQLVTLATDLAEKQLAAGTASAQVITHYLKLATGRERLEREKLKHENLLLQARTASMDSGKHRDELYARAIAAISEYKGETPPEDLDE